MKFNRETFHSPIAIFIIYITISCLLLFFYNQLFPAQESPLGVFEKGWKLNRSFLEIFAIFPALLLSALVIPFGILRDEDMYSSFSLEFFQRIKGSIVLAFIASSLYILISFLVLPIAENNDKDMRFKGELYKMSKEQMQKNVNEKKWIEASQFLSLCDSVWYNSPELNDMRDEIEINLALSGFNSQGKSAASYALVSELPGYGNPIDSKEAIILSEAAFNENKYFDAHWFASLGERISQIGSIERVHAARLAVLAWDEIEKQQPSNIETSAYSFFHQKMDAYETMNSGDWILAYYKFKELHSISPDDPDIVNFLEASEKSTREIAFFLNEMETHPGQSFTGILFSLPGKHYERMVMKVSNLNYSPDFAYGIGIEYMVFDDKANIVLSMEAPYAKFSPITIDNNHQVLVLMRALDLHAFENRWEPIWSGLSEEEYQGDVQIILDISYETFVLLSRLRQGISGMNFIELFSAAGIAETTGYIPQVFQAEIINRLSSSLLFLPLTFLTISIGWSLRTRRRSRFMFLIMLPALPLVFLSIIQMFQNILNITGISLVLTFSFSTALTIFIVFLTASTVGSLIYLAGRRS